MVGVLYIVTIPQKQYEQELYQKEKLTKIVLEKEKYEKASKVIHEVKRHRLFGSTKSSVESYATDEDSNIVISKCKSTDCLHTNGNTGLCKSKSENTLNEVCNEGYKSAWGEVKTVVKVKRNKVNITRPVRGVEVLEAFHWDTPLETILADVLTRLKINSAAWNSTRDDKFWKVTFSLKSGDLCEELLQVLRTFGIGSRNQSSMSVLPCTLYYQSSEDEVQTACKDNWQRDFSENSAWSGFCSSVRARNNLAQVLQDVRAGASLTFDWLFLLLVAAFVSAIGLVENSTVILVASMLISPLMGPITAGTLGTAVRDRSLQHMGLLHELLGLFLALVLGFIFGLTICAVDERYGIGDWPTKQMMSRCEIRSLWVGVLVAIPSGAAAALAILGEYTASLVGVAISASLLPPAVNAGLLWAMALVHLIFADDNTRFTAVVTSSIYSVDPATELAVSGTVSLCLTLVNILCVFLAGVTVYKVKEVCPLEKRDISWWRANRDLLQTTKSNRQDPSQMWDMYSKWCNDSTGLEQAHEPPRKEFPPVQSDTVTYRRPGFHRLKTQNIEDYCSTMQGSKNPESFTPLEIDSLEVESKDSKTKENSENLSTNSSVHSSDKSMDNLKSLHHTDYSYYNSGFESIKKTNNTEHVEDLDKTHYPIIEPSLNLTVDAKNHGIVLGTKTFHV